MIKDSTISLRLSADLRADVERLAKAEDRSMAYIMVRAIREHVERELAKLKSRKG